MSNKRFASVWDAISPTPQEAENMKLRSALMMALDRQIQSRGWTQAEAASQLGVTQPRISDLVRGKIGRFSLDRLVKMVSAAGLHIHVQVDEAA
jgi:predicted XRE-type DNA-binding protein